MGTIARHLCVHHSTVARALERHGLLGERKCRRCGEAGLSGKGARRERRRGGRHRRACGSTDCWSA
ncbi:MAG: hypothetical protein MUQ26_08510 [Armatimonadetes bacterium]|nr:hypothetical protein [Armatimonadota bacterium]